MESGLSSKDSSTFPFHASEAVTMTIHINVTGEYPMLSDFQGFINPYLFPDETGAMTALHFACTS